MPTSAVARPPKAWEKAIRSGIFVIGRRREIAVPIPPPASIPTNIHSKLTTSALARVATTATSIPISPRKTPRLAFSGDESPRKQEMNNIDATR